MCGFNFGMNLVGGLSVIDMLIRVDFTMLVTSRVF